MFGEEDKGGICTEAARLGEVDVESFGEGADVGRICHVI